MFLLKILDLIRIMNSKYNTLQLVHVVFAYMSALAKRKQFRHRVFTGQQQLKVQIYFKNKSNFESNTNIILSNSESKYKGTDSV